MRIVAIYAISGWLFGAIVMKKAGLAALILPDTIQASIVAALVGCLWGNVLLWSQRWYVSALLTLPSAVLAVWLYFVIWPVQNWNISAWNVTLVILKSYTEYLIPLALTGGAFAAWWAERPLPRPAWLTEEPEPGEETVG